MSKYDAYLTEVVYEIDDLVYDFYKKSNELIATRKNQDRLIDFRDKTITTLNDMNVRSLEIISQFKNVEMVEKRVAVLVEKNKSILDSAVSVIESDQTSGTSAKEIYDSVYNGARKMMEKASDPETLDKFKAAASEGIDRMSDGLENLKNTLHTMAEDPRFKEGIQKTKETAQDLVSYGNEAIKVSSQKLKDWLDSRSETTPKDESKSVLDDVSELTQKNESELTPKEESESTLVDDTNMSETFDFDIDAQGDHEDEKSNDI